MFEQTKQSPMAWHGFLIRCMLWIAPLVHLAQAAWLLLGKAYYNVALRDHVYGMLGLKLLDWALIVLLVAAALLQFAAGRDLARRRWRGARRLVWAYGLLGGGMMAYLLLRLLVTGLSPLSPALLGQAICYWALMWVNQSYYRKRRAGFTPAEGETK